MKIIKQNNKKTSDKDNYHTPKILYDAFMEKQYMDPCPYDPNFIINALTIEWGEKCFVNPPYSNIEPFVDKALDEIKMGKTKICYFLVPSNTGTKWFRKLVQNCHKIIFFTERLKFNDGKYGATFDTCLISITELSVRGKNLYLDDYVVIDFMKVNECIKYIY